LRCGLCCLLKYFRLSVDCCGDVADEWESCSSEDDEDSDGSWIDVPHSSDEEQVFRYFVVVLPFVK